MTTSKDITITDDTDAGSSQKNMMGKYFYALGRRKEAIARAKIFTNGSGNIRINNREMESYFPIFEHQKIISSPFRQVGQEGKLDAEIQVIGGGIKGQAESILLALSRALTKLNPNYHKALKKVGFLTRDARKKERKKPGLKSARVREQWRTR